MRHLKPTGLLPVTGVRCGCRSEGGIMWGRVSEMMALDIAYSHVRPEAEDCLRLTAYLH